VKGRFLEEKQIKINENDKRALLFIWNELSPSVKDAAATLFARRLIQDWQFAQQILIFLL
jgi:hypothetical protein